MILGTAAVLGGLALTPESLDSIRTGIPIHTLHGPDMDGWIVLAALGFIVALGGSLVASALLTMRKFPDDQ